MHSNVCVQFLRSLLCTYCVLLMNKHEAEVLWGQHAVNRCKCSNFDLTPGSYCRLQLVTVRQAVTASDV